MRPMRAIAWCRQTFFGVKLIPWQVQATLILIGYAAVLTGGVWLEYERDLAALRDPVYSSGGMWAFGDEMLAWYIFFFFLIPTFFLIRLFSDFPETFAAYSKVALWASLTAPLCLGVTLLGSLTHNNAIFDPLLWRTWRAPFVLMVLVMSRFFAGAGAAKRLLNRALLIEGGSLAIFVTLLIAPNLGRR